MNRKLRVWLKAGVLYPDHKGNWIDPRGLVYLAPGKWAMPGDYDDYSSDEIIVQESTGLLDKNGKDIYEGDILRVHTFEDWMDEVGHYHNMVVENGVLPSGESSLSGYLYIPDNREIIGNIIENPDNILVLVKGKVYTE